MKKKKATGALADEVAIITGGASGIGRAAVVEFARLGAAVIVADIDDAGGRKTVRLVRTAGGRAHYQHCDVSRAEDAQGVVARALKEFGRLTILYNNAATTVLCNEHDRPVTELEERVWDKMLAVCLKGVFLCSKHAIPHIIAAGGGCVLNTSSVDAVLAEPGFDAYTAAKGGVISMTRSMAGYYAQFGVRVNCIVPGFVETECQQGWLADPAKRAAAEALHPGGIARPEEVARFAAFIVSPQARRITGAMLPIDGGFTAVKTSPKQTIDPKAGTKRRERSHGKN